jgi:hypothetical protein
LPRKPTLTDPAEIANQKILENREKRIIQAELAKPDFGLQLDTPPPTSAADVLADEWDKNAFGAPPKTTTRVVYGPDPLVRDCPEFHEALEKYGKEGVAERYRILVMEKGADAFPDPIMRRGVRTAIARNFSKEQVAQACYDRVMRIPSRVVEIETGDSALDPLLVNPMRALVDRYCEPGMSPKFLSPRCIDVLGKRGYEIVKDEHGDPVKCGTLIMGVIPTEWAERRRAHFAEISQEAVREQESSYYETAARAVHDTGVGGAGPLRPGESVRADATENDPALLGLTREAGIRIERQR